MKVGVIGVGGFAQLAILPGFAESPHVEIAAVCDREPVRLGAVAERYNVGLATTDVDELLARRDLDLVLVATRPGAHRELCGRVIEAGHNLMCEKPVCLSSGEVAELLDLAERKGVMHAVDHEFRYTQSTTAMRNLLPKVGRVRFVAVSMIFDYGMNPAAPTYYWSYNARKALGGGVLPQLLSHTIDLMGQLFGGIERAAGQLAIIEPMRPIFDEEAFFDRTVARSAPPPGTERRAVECEDTLAFGGLLGNGAAFSLNSSWSVYGGPGSRWEIYGDQGTLRLETTDYMRGGTLWFTGPDTNGPVVVEVPAEISAFIPFAEDLAAALDGRAPQNGGFATLADELRVWRTIETLRAAGHHIVPA